MAVSVSVALTRSPAVFPLSRSHAGVILHTFTYIRLTYITSGEARFGKIITYLTARWSVGGWSDDGGDVDEWFEAFDKLLKSPRRIILVE